MPSLLETAGLISAASSPGGAARLVAALGFGAPLALDAAARASMGIAGFAARAWVAPGPGALRCCLITPRPGEALRTVAARCAARLVERSPHALWLAVVFGGPDHLIAVALPPTAGAQRVVALVTDTRRVQDSDAETIAAMSNAMASGDVAAHHRWRELLGRDTLTRRFYRELEAAVSGLAASAMGSAPNEARREAALVCTSRLIFLAFLEAKGWLDGDREFLRHRFDARCAAGGRVHRRLLDPLCFGTLNTPLQRRAAAARAFGRVPFLNGGLFARAAVERAWPEMEFDDDAIGRVVCGLLGRYRVTVREESTSWSEAAIDPEMLGRAFESLMASERRRATGTFYTPVGIIERVTAAGLDAWFAERGVAASALDRIRAGEPLAAADRELILSLVTDIRVLDPACGSGSFLVHAMERLADIRALAGDDRPVSARRRDVLARSIFGVDVNPMAVWLCELRLWLSVVVDAADRNWMAVAPLPNLDHNVRVGDALAGCAFGEEPTTIPAAPRLTMLRRRYSRASGSRKRTLARALDASERQIAAARLAQRLARLTALRREILAHARGRDLFARRAGTTAAMRADLMTVRGDIRDARRHLAELRRGGALPFSFDTQFADVGARDGFDLVVGNPPWVRLHEIGAAARADLAARFRSWRNAAWLDGARGARAGRGFASQLDLSTLFLERAVQIARPGGTLSMLVPVKLWRSLAAGGLRRVLSESCRLVAFEDWSESPAAFDAVVYPSMIVAVRAHGATGDRPGPTADAPGDQADAAHGDGRNDRPMIRHRIHRGASAFGWDIPAHTLPFDASPGAPWIMLPPLARDGFDLLAARGTPFSQSVFRRPVLGVKTGRNDAFVVQPQAGHGDDECTIRTVDGIGRIESALLRPVLRGEDVRAWRAERARRAIVWTHGAAGAPLDRLPPLAAAHFAHWRAALTRRADAARALRFWTLYRTEAADASRHRVVWSDISRVPRATVLAAGDATVPLNSCYVAFAPSADDALTLAVLLNSEPVAAWLCALAEPARGGYRRFLGWTMAQLPLPADWTRAVELLAPIGRAAMRAPPDPESLSQAVAGAYGVSLSDLAPLIVWCLR